eukprot:9180906-Alexandrium_andersonii.AAC.1
MTDGMVRSDGPSHERSRSQDPPAAVPGAGVGGAGRLSSAFRCGVSSVGCGGWAGVVAGGARKRGRTRRMDRS